MELIQMGIKTIQVTMAIQRGDFDLGSWDLSLLQREMSFNFFAVSFF